MSIRRPLTLLSLDDTRILNVPNADLGRSDKILVYTDAMAEKPTRFGDFRVAAGGKKLCRWDRARPTARR